MTLIDWMKRAARRTIDNRPTDESAPATTSTTEGVARRYKNMGEIARGGMGAIVQVKDRDLRRTLVMKVFDPEDGRIDDGRVGLFIEEAQINAQLDHPNICPVHDVGHDADGSHFFTMKLVRGRTLTDMIHADTYDPSDPRCLREAIEVLETVCDALAFAHAKGVVHRDLKPDNIMVGDFGQVYLMDWGIAKIVPSTHAEAVTIERPASSAIDQAGAIVGTLMYMAPEQARGEADAVDARSDVFGVGAILYEIITQIPPYYAQSVGELVLQAQSAAWRPPQDVNGADLVVPSALCAICEKALAADPAQRHQSIGELRDDLEQFLVGGLTFPTRVVPAGECVVVEGDAGVEAFIVQRGYCRVYKVHDGEQIALADLGPGDVFGETSVFADVPRTATVQALTDVTLQVVTKEVFDKDLGMASAMGAFVKALAKRFVATDGELRALKSGAAPPAAAEEAAPAVKAPAVETPGVQAPPAAVAATSTSSPFALVDVAVRLQALSDGKEPGALLFEALALGVEELARRRDARPADDG